MHSKAGETASLLLATSRTPSKKLLNLVAPFWPRTLLRKQSSKQEERAKRRCRGVPRHLDDHFKAAVFAHSPGVRVRTGHLIPATTRIGLDNWRVWILDRTPSRKTEGTPYESLTHYRPGTIPYNKYNPSRTPFPKSFPSPNLRGRHDLFFCSPVLVLVNRPFLFAYPFGRSLSSTLTTVCK